MSAELAAVIVLVYIGWNLERILRALKALEMELSTARWERGKRMSSMEETLLERVREQIGKT